MSYLLKATFFVLKKLANILGYEISVSKAVAKPDEITGLNLNIAAGDYIIPGFKSLDIYTPHYYKTKEEFLVNRIEYDLRKDNIPFSDGSVDNIYISHAVEHVEDFAVHKFIEESYRVLKKRGVLRIACPDSRFLYSVSQFKNDYWSWRVSMLSNKNIYITDWKDCNQYDFLIRELASPRMRFYKNNIQEEVISNEELKSLEYAALTKRLKHGLKFRDKHPGEHINNWDFTRIKHLGEKVGFAHAIESKCRGSVSSAMQGPDFDKTHTQMSLYVDLIR